MKEYALYKGETILALGTANEIAKKMGIKKETVWYYGTPRYKRKLKERGSLNKNVRMLVPLDD